MGLLYNYNLFSLRRTNKHGSSGPNLPLNLFFTEFMFFITLSRHSQKHNFSTFSSKIYSWTSLQFIFSPLNFFHRPVFRPVPRTLGNSHRVSNSHLTFSSVYNNSFDYMVEIYLVYLFISAVEILRTLIHTQYLNLLVQMERFYRDVSYHLSSSNWKPPTTPDYSTLSYFQ